MTAGQPRIYGKSLAAKGRRQPPVKAATGPPCACGCGKPIPPLAVVHGDEYATMTCFQKAQGIITQAEADRIDRRHRNTSGDRAFASQTGPYEGTDASG